MTEGIDRRAQIAFIAHRKAEAYDRAPWGTWVQRWIPGVCKHEHVRCAHGDEIEYRQGARAVCLVCGRSLRHVEPPKVCYFTGNPHRQSP